MTDFKKSIKLLLTWRVIIWNKLSCSSVSQAKQVHSQHKACENQKLFLKDEQSSQMVGYI
jgi:hypothetical protein